MQAADAADARFEETTVRQATALMLALGLWPAHALAQDSHNPSRFAPTKVSSCFEPWTANLRLSQLDHGIELCSRIAEDRSAPAKTRGEALAQRGLLHARRWSIVELQTEALQGIADVTEGLRLHTPDNSRKHHLLVVRAQLYVATGQLRRAADDYRTVIAAEPDNEPAKAGLRRIGQPETN
jgi:hypothetical protein